MAGVRRQLGLDPVAHLCGEIPRARHRAGAARHFPVRQARDRLDVRAGRRVTGLSRQVRGIPRAYSGGRTWQPRRGLRQAADRRRQGRSAKSGQGVEQVGRRHRDAAAQSRDGRAFHQPRRRRRRGADRKSLHGEPRLARGRPAAARRFEAEGHPRRHRPGTTRHLHAADRRVEAETGMARGRAQHHPRRRTSVQRARQPRRAGARHGSIRRP